MTTKLTTEQVEEILAGCEGVTPGPWRISGLDADQHIAAPYGDDGIAFVSIAWEMRDPELRHIARLDPQTVASLATELLALRKRVEELEGALEDAARMAERGILSADGGQAASEIRSLTPQRLRQTTNLETTASIGGLNDLTSIIAHGIADAQGEAYAEYASEFDGYAKAAVDALKKHSAGLSVGGVNVWGEPEDIKAVMEWQHSHATIDDVRTSLRHWREECGKVHAHRREMLDVLKRAIAVWDADDFDELAANAVLKDAIEIVARLEKRA